MKVFFLLVYIILICSSRDIPKLTCKNILEIIQHSPSKVFARWITILMKMKVGHFNIYTMLCIFKYQF